MAALDEVSLKSVSADATSVSRAELLSPYERLVLSSDEVDLDELYLHALGWQNFEKLIAKLAIATFELGPVDSKPSIQGFRYGREGQKQFGIDILVLGQIDNELIKHVYQAKHTRSVSAHMLRSSVNEFLAGPDAENAHRFVFCTTASVERDARLLDVWASCVEQLKCRNIQAILWDKTQLNDLLRHQWGLVAQLFNRSVATRFCKDTPPVGHARLYRPEHISHNQRYLHLENRTARLSVLLPDADFHLSALLELTREDLKGVSIQIEADELVRWCEWRRFAPADSERPYALVSHLDTDNFFFGGRACRVWLSFEELGHVDWLLKSVHPYILEASLGLCDSWQVHRFRRRENQFIIARVMKWFWSDIREFAASHDTDRGTSDWHIFEDGPSHSYLKVYSANGTARLDAGFHFHGRAIVDNSFEPFDSSVLVTWIPPSEFGQGESLSPRGRWDAETAHSWFMNKLVPAVLASNSSRRAPWRKWVPFLRSNHELLRVTDVAYSKAEETAYLPQLPGNDRHHLGQALHALQIFFSLSRLVFRDELRKRVLKAVRELIFFAGANDNPYIRTKLDISPDEDLCHGLDRLIREEHEEVSSGSLDYCVRVLIEALESYGAGRDASRLVRELQPVWEVYKSHYLLRWWREDR